MKILYKILGIGILLSSSLGFAAEVDHFVVEVKPNPTKINQANDLTIKAVDVNGNIVTDYEGDVLMTVTDENGQDVTDNQDVVVLPDDGVATFTVDDEGVKTYFKGLIFKKPGTYTLQVSDLTNTDISGESKVQVNGEDNNTITAKIQIDSPLNGSTETKLPIDISATTDSPNTIYEIYVDDSKVKEGLTDENGQINDTIDELSPGSHTLYIKLLDANNNVVGQSEKVNFEYKPATDNNLFKDIKIYPSDKVKVGEQVVFEVNTAPGVQSAELKIEGLGTYPMDREQDGKFKLTLQLDKAGTYNVSVVLYKDGMQKEYNNVATIQVIEGIEIKNVKIKPDPQNKKVDISWDYTGHPAGFKIMFGEDKNNLYEYKVVTNNNISITGLDDTKTYYVQIIPVDNYGQVAGQSSNVLSFSLNMKPSASSCVVKDIKIRLVNQDGKHYLVWDKVDGVEKYIIYVADKPDGPFDKVGETTDTKWEYPFDPNTEKVIYKYYKVEAQCEDGNVVQIDKVKKVKVGPEKTILLLLLIGLLLYSYIKLQSFYNKE